MEVPVAHIAAAGVSDAENEKEEQLSDQLGEEDDHVGGDEREDAEASHSSSAAEVSGGEVNNDVEDGHQHADVEDNDLAMEDEAYLDQSRRTKKGDAVSFCEGGHWIEEKSTSALQCSNRDAILLQCPWRV